MTDDKLMRRAIQLAKKGRGKVSPNPMVGCVVEKDGEIIGEGYHEKFGKAHAEVVALEKAGAEAENATLYVNLEPCNCHSKTGACTDEIIEAGINKVVTAMEDPNPEINGQGIEQLRNAGIEVDVGILEEEAKKLNRGFIKVMKEGRPWLTLKLALTTDGYIGDSTGKSKWITSNDSLKYVRDSRARHDSVMVGRGTVMKDNPSLLPNNKEKFIPYRILIDESLTIPYKVNLVNDDYTDRTIILTADDEKEKRWNEFEKRHINIVQTNRLDIGWIDLYAGLEDIAEEGVTSIYCEGGGRLAGSLIERGLVDELQIFIAPKIIGEGIKSFSGIKKPLDDAIQLQWNEVKEFGQDIMLKGKLA